MPSSIKRRSISRFWTGSPSPVRISQLQLRAVASEVCQRDRGFPHRTLCGAGHVADVLVAGEHRSAGVRARLDGEADQPLCWVAAVLDTRVDLLSDVAALLEVRAFRRPRSFGSAPSISLSNSGVPASSVSVSQVGSRTDGVEPAVDQRVEDGLGVVGATDHVVLSSPARSSVRMTERRRHRVRPARRRGAVGYRSGGGRWRFSLSISARGRRRRRSRERFLEFDAMTLSPPTPRNSSSAFSRDVTTKALAGVVHIHVRVDAAVGVEQERVTARAVLVRDAIRDGVVDVVDAVLAGDDDDAVAVLHRADDVPNRAVGPLRSPVVVDDLPTTDLPNALRRPRDRTQEHLLRDAALVGKNVPLAPSVCAGRGYKPCGHRHGGGDALTAPSVASRSMVTGHGDVPD